MKAVEPIAQFDLDGTLADYDGAMNRDMRLISSPTEPPWQRDADHPVLSSSRWDDAPEYIKERVRLIRNQPGWWERLEKYPPGFEILSELKALKFKCHVLTKGPASASASWTEKVRWCQKHVPDLPITVTQDKGLVYGKVLVDDWPEYVIRWLEWRPRGLVVMPAHPWNNGYQHPNVIRYYGEKSLAELRARLEAILTSTIK